MQRISSEFAGFVRDTGVRAFDRLTERSKDVDAPLRPVLRAWNKLSDDQKGELLDELIASVQATDSEVAPVDSKSAKKNIRRFNPEEVEPTLPKKTRKKAAPAKKKKRVVKD